MIARTPAAGIAQASTPGTEQVMISEVPSPEVPPGSAGYPSTPLPLPQDVAVVPLRYSMMMASKEPAKGDGVAPLKENASEKYCSDQKIVPGLS